MNSRAECGKIFSRLKDTRFVLQLAITGTAEATTTRVRMGVSLCIDARQFVQEYKSLRALTEAVYLVARNASDHKVVEIVVLEETEEGKVAEEGVESCGLKIAALLQYFVTPQYLVKETFKTAMSSGGLSPKVFAEAKKFPPLEALRPLLQPWRGGHKFRDGVAIVRRPVRAKTASGKVKKTAVKDKTTGFVNVGLSRAVELGGGVRVPFGVRVTVQMHGDDKEAAEAGAEDKEVAEAAEAAEKGVYPCVVSPEAAWHYAGFSVRVAQSVASVFGEAGAATGGSGYSRVFGVDRDNNNKASRDGDAISKQDNNHLLVAICCVREAWDASIHVGGSAGTTLIADATVAGLTSVSV